MPVYEYECVKCGHRFEVIHSPNDRPSVSCEQCGSESRKVFHPVPIIFKGSGFHVTDYGRANKPKTSSPSESKSKGKRALEETTSKANDLPPLD